MSLSSEEQLAVARHLASSGAEATDIQKQLKKVCGKTTLPVTEVQQCVEVKKKVEKPPEPPTVRKILTKKMKMVKENGCWKPVFIDPGNGEEDDK